MNTNNERLSVPPVRKTLPRPLTDDERTSLVALADVLCGPSDKAAPPSQQEEFNSWLELAIATRSDSFDLLMNLTSQAATVGNLDEWLRQLHDTEPVSFQVLSAVLGGAYLMVPAVRTAIGYPGQRRDPAGLEEAVDELSDGILDPVMERGYFFVPTPTVPGA